MYGYPARSAVGIQWAYSSRVPTFKTLANEQTLVGQTIRPGPMGVQLGEVLDLLYYFSFSVNFFIS